MWKFETKRWINLLLKDHQKLGYGAMNGIPMVATSPGKEKSLKNFNCVGILQVGLRQVNLNLWQHFFVCFPKY